MFDNYCRAYRKSVRHMDSAGFMGVEPEGNAKWDLIEDSPLERMPKSSFINLYCKECLSDSCKMCKEVAFKMQRDAAFQRHDSSTKNSGRNAVELVNPVTQEQTTTYITKLTDIPSEVYFNVPDEHVEMAKVVGRIQHPVEDISLFCQALITDLNGYYISLLYFDYRDFGKNTIVYDDIKKVYIKMNAAGEFIDYGEYPVYKMDNKNTFMVTFNIGEVDFDDAVYRTKAAFKRIADRVFEEVVV